MTDVEIVETVTFSVYVNAAHFFPSLSVSACVAVAFYLSLSFFFLFIYLILLIVLFHMSLRTHTVHLKK